MTSGDPKEDINLKLNVLKKAIIDERKKNQVLLKENNSLKEKINEKDDIISKLQSDNRQLQDSILKQDPKAYYDSLLSQPTPEVSPTEKINLKKEIEDLKEENICYQEQNVALKNQLEELTVELDNVRATLNERIEFLTQELNNQNKINEENKLKTQVMTDLYSEYETKKNEYEQKIKDLTKEGEELRNDNEDLSKQNNVLINTITHLTKEIENMSTDKYKLEKEIEEHKEIDKNYLFKGNLIVKNGNTRNRPSVELFFGKYEEAVILKIKDIERIITMKDFNSIKVSSKKKSILIINFSDNGKVIEFECEFTQRECEFVIKFFTEMKNKYVQINSQMMTLTYGDYFV